MNKFSIATLLITLLTTSAYAEDRQHANKEQVFKHLVEMAIKTHDGILRYWKEASVVLKGHRHVNNLNPVVKRKKKTCNNYVSA